MNPAPPKPSRPWQGRHAPLGPVRGIPSPRTEHTDMGGGLGRCRPPSLSGRKLRERAGRSRLGFEPCRQDSGVRLRIEHVPQPVAEHVEAEHRDKDGGSGAQLQVPGVESPARCAAARSWRAECPRWCWVRASPMYPAGGATTLWRICSIRLCGHECGPQERGNSNQRVCTPDDFTILRPRRPREREPLQCPAHRARRHE